MPTDNDVDCGISFVVSSVSFSSLLPSINRRTRLPGRPGSLVFWAAAAAASAIATKAHHVEMLPLLSLSLIPFPGSCVLRPMCILVLCARSPLFLLHFALTFWVYGIFALWLCCSDAWPGLSIPPTFYVLLVAVCVSFSWCTWTMTLTLSLRLPWMHGPGLWTRLLLTQLLTRQITTHACIKIMQGLTT